MAAAAVPALWPTRAAAQNYPAQPVHVLIGYEAGTAADVLARLVSYALAARLWQPFVIENRPGAGTSIATEAAVRAAPDGRRWQTAPRSLPSRISW